MITKKTSRGFYFGEWITRLGFNLMSCCIGAWIRLSILIFFFIIQAIYVFTIPLLLISYFISIPINFLIYLIQPSCEVIKNKIKTDFIRTHLLQSENQIVVERWFDYFYKNFIEKTRWWKLHSLFLTPPLGRDWTQGYTPTLDDFCINLTSSEYQKPIKRIFGRENEIKTIETALTKTQSANVIIIGEEGVGKHTLIDDVAYHIYNGQTNPLLAYKRLLKINLEKILTQTTDQKQRENLLSVLLEEAEEAKNVIILIDNFDKYVSGDQDRVDLTLVFEKMAKSEHLQIIGITTPFLYQKHIYNNDHLNHLFTPVNIKEINRSQAEEIMLDVCLRYEKHYQITIPYETIIATVDKSDFYITSIPFPEKAIDLLDHACSSLLENSKSKKNLVLLPAHIDETLSSITHTPTQLSQKIKDKLNSLETDLNNKIINQGVAINSLSSALRRSFVLLGKRKKPLASFLFLGPTGVGKTETAKALNSIFFKDTPIIRFDMSLYQSKDDIPNLIGSPETNQPGQLTNALRNNPYGVLLLDEIEKADRDLLNIFLTIFDEGYYNDGNDKRVDCKNLIIIATSNAGTNLLFTKNTSLISPKITNNLISFLTEENLFSPEFLNRFDGVILFNPIDKISAETIAKAKLQIIINDIYKLYKVKISVKDEMINQVVASSNYAQFGARELERTLRQTIEDKIVKLILENKVKEAVKDEMINQVVASSNYAQFGARELERTLRQTIEDKIVKLILENKVKEGDSISL
ncbi:AAA domain-containing protein [Candidatus Roizmanbacteria bacterium]|nr:AAA domain-containing protein [Candidatus Roizmanbacteria bacterium]